MTQLTLRGFDPELERRLRELAARDHLSLNKAALRLMRRGAGLESEPVPVRNLGRRLQRFAGRLSDEEAQAIDDVIHDSRDQDKKLQA